MATVLGVFLVCVACGLLLIEQQVASQETKTVDKAPRNVGHVEAGRNVFNGKGVCHYCHGIDGYVDKPPQLAPDTAALIARLNPPPPDLRNPKTLHLTSDKARAKAIREGHTGTGMFPTTTLTEQELVDTLTYLSALRDEGYGPALTDRKASAGNAKRGAELYQASCVVCHGPRATGDIGPKLAGNPVLSNDQAFWKIVHEGRHVMPPLRGTVSDEQMTDIRAWLKSLP